MRLTALVFVFVFVFVMVLAVGSVPYAIGQTLTTITNVSTSTGFYTSNVYSTNTVGTTTETVVSENTIVSTADTIIAPPGQRWCEYDWWNITVSPGTTAITGTVGPPNSKIDFFIMNQDQYYDFSHYGSCSAMYSAEVAVYGLTSTYSVDWTNPPPGWYYFIFFNEQIGGSTPVVTPFVLVAAYNQTQTSTAYTVVTNQVSGAVTQTVTSLQVTQVPASVSLGSGSNLGIIAGIVIVILVVVAALYFVKSRQRSEDGKQKATQGKKTDDPLLCSNCGKPLPVGSKFCNKCGATQE